MDHPLVSKGLIEIIDKLITSTANRRILIELFYYSKFKPRQKKFPDFFIFPQHYVAVSWLLVVAPILCDGFVIYCKFGNFAKVLFSRNFAYAKFRENKIVAKW